MFNNTWTRIVDWFSDRSERKCLIRSFNESARIAFISGGAPTLLKASFSSGNSNYRHQFSAWVNRGFRITALAGQALSKEEMMVIGKVVLNNSELVRRLIVLGWDTLEVQSDKGYFGCQWKLIDYANMGLMIE